MTKPTLFHTFWLLDSFFCGPIIYFSPKVVHFFELLQRKPRISKVSPCKVKNLVATLYMLDVLYARREWKIVKDLWTARSGPLFLNFYQCQLYKRMLRYVSIRSVKRYWSQNIIHSENKRIWTRTWSRLLKMILNQTPLWSRVSGPG